MPIKVVYTDGHYFSGVTYEELQKHLIEEHGFTIERLENRYRIELEHWHDKAHFNQKLNHWHTLPIRIIGHELKENEH